ncbi:MAG: sugar phosphate isomerase/epimerase [Planctomycetaceae bacterium]|nr:sugar phosphate isomerase/epimerase [Planctomycetaceae bacterium]
MPHQLDRRSFLQATGSLLGALGLAPGSLWSADKDSSEGMKLGLVTYNWGKDWDIPTIISNCEQTKFSGIELRSTHKHGVEISLSPLQRTEVRKQFDGSAVELVGLGSACEYHSPDSTVLKNNIEETKAFVRLCRDVGGTGVKVRPNGLPSDIPVPKTLEQIGRALNEVAQDAADFGVEIRLEVHGRGTSELPHIKTITDHADHPNAVVCWNCNPTDLQGDGLAANFALVSDRIGTVHIHDLRTDAYPWQQLFGLLKQARFSGWTLLEEGKVPDDIVGTMAENRKVWDAFMH